MSSFGKGLPWLSMRARNAPKLLGIWGFNVAVFWGVATGALSVSDVDALLALLSEVPQDLWVAGPFAGFLTLFTVINNAVPRPAKERLVFWSKPRPGCRAFSHFMFQDSAIDRKALEVHFAPLPSEPDEQNALWVKWLHEFENDHKVRPAYRLYLLMRDWATVAVVTLAVAGPLALWFAEGTKTALSYAAFLLTQYFLARWVARVQGERMIMAVMSCKGASLSPQLGEPMSGTGH